VDAVAIMRLPTKGWHSLGRNGQFHIMGIKKKVNWREEMEKGEIEILNNNGDVVTIKHSSGRTCTITFETSPERLRMGHMGSVGWSVPFVPLSPVMRVRIPPPTPLTMH